jgi:hypothetical protein
MKYETIKILATTAKKLRRHKEEFGTPISTFVELAVEDKLKVDKQVREILASKKK